MNAEEQKEDLKKKAAMMIEVVRAVGDVIKELGSIPSGELYAVLMPKMDLDAYMQIIGVLKEAKVVSESNHLLTWIGPK